MITDALEAALAALDIAENPDQWATAAVRLAIGRGEIATTKEQLASSLELLDRAGRILTAERAPLEHGRILTAAANLHRSAGRPDLALPLFERAEELLAPRAATAEQGAALTNIGLVLAELGRGQEAMAALDRSLELIGDPTDAESVRLRGATLVNRAQACQSIASDDMLRAAIADYREAAATLPSDSPQAGMALHGAATAMLELLARGDSAWTPADAVDTLTAALAILGASSFPFQHAIARHSLALALARRDRPGDLIRALDSAEASLAIFDPRLHEVQWRTAETLLSQVHTDLNARSGEKPRIDHVAQLLATADKDECRGLLRERLLRAAPLPKARLERDIDQLVHAITALPRGDYQHILPSMIHVLMELPDQVLEAACASLCRAQQEHPDTEDLERRLDEAVHETLFGPQRVRVRDLLTANGWIRP